MHRTPEHTYSYKRHATLAQAYMTYPFVDRSVAQENKFLTACAFGNGSFTGVVNHTGQGLRGGKNPVAKANDRKRNPQRRLLSFVNVTL